MKLRKFLAGSLITISALVLCSCGKEKGIEQGNKNESTKTEITDDGTYRSINVENNDGELVHVLINGNGVVKLSGFSDVDDFYKNAAVALDKDSQYGIIDIKGNEIVPFGEYTFIHRQDQNLTFYDYYIVRNKDKKYGVIDGTGKIIIPCEFKEIFTGYYNDYRNSNDDLSAVPLFDAINSDGSIDIYSRFGTKIVSGFDYSDTIKYECLEKNSDNFGVFYYQKEGTDTVCIISEKTGETILSLEKTKDVEIKIYSTGIITCNNDSEEKYEVYLLSRDCTSCMKIDDKEVALSNITDTYRVISYYDNFEEYKNKALFFDDSGKLCFTIDRNNHFYAFGKGKNTKYYSEMEKDTYDVYDYQLNKIGQCFDLDGCSEYFYFTENEKNSHLYTVYDREGKIIVDNVERLVPNDKVKLDENTYMTYISGVCISHPKDVKPKSALFHGYALFQDDNGFSVYSEDGKLCDCGNIQPHRLAGVKIYYIGSKYYNYKGELLYESKY